MAYEELPITPALITWARARAGISIEEASKTFKRIQAWEDGESFPTYPQLEQLADAFKVPVAVFFFPEPPDVPDISETFRTLPDTEFSQIPSRVRLLLRKAKALQLNLMELTGGRPTSERLVTRDLTFVADVSLREMAERVRAYVGVSIEDQQRWADDDTALKNWRRALLDAGIYVFKDAFRIEEFSGFCLYDDIFPIIYVNNSSPKTRQMFTLFHELAHLLFHTSGIDTIHDEYIPHLTDDARRIEILCNRFAAEFLLPEQAFNVAIRGSPATEGTAEHIATSFHVSREVVFRRFLDRGLIDQRTYNEATARWAAQRQTGGGPGGDYYWTKLTYLGRDYVALALSQYRQNRIDERQLAEYLDTKPKNLAGIEEYFARGGT
jgi:Zn-dependent peptidase ImmA (M78 family)/transcriptional regulator with XRE-family HTH domain